MENNDIPSELLNAFLKDGQEIDDQLPNPPESVELPDDVMKDIWEDHETDYWVSYRKENPVD